ncbi:MAG: ZIP family metal transporter [Clostridia bacterium]|nr:ZIP family metal transporter [Clostridia bacterium]
MRRCTLAHWQSALAAGLFTWGVTALGAGTVIFFARAAQRVMDGMLGFGAGVMIASSFFSLLSPGITLAEELGQLPWLTAATGFLAGGLVPDAGERLLRAHLGGDSARRRSRMLISAITLHNIPEGLAVGVAFGALAQGESTTAAWMLAVGIGLQNFPEGAAVSLPLRRDGATRGRSFFLGQLSGVVEPLSALVGAMIAARVRTILPFTLCFAAGAMIAVAVSELIPESQRNPRPAVITLCTLAGFAAMMCLDVALG